MKSIFKIDQTTKGFLCLLSVFAARLSSCDDDNLSDGNVTDGSIEFRFDLPQTRAVIAEQTGEGFSKITTRWDYTLMKAAIIVIINLPCKEDIGFPLSNPQNWEK